MKKTILILAFIVMTSYISKGQSTTASNTLTGTLPASPTQYLGSANAADVLFKSGGAIRMRMMSTGNIGIGTGTTATVSRMLQIYSTTNNNNLFLTGADPGMAFSDALNGTEYASIGIATTAGHFVTGSIVKDLVIRSCNTQNSILFATYNGTSLLERMRITSAGLVGIGTATPVHPLHVKGNITLEGTNSTLLFGQNYPTTTANWGQWGIEYEVTAGGLNFWKPFNSNNYGNFFLFIKDEGNVGIGTTNFSNGSTALYYKLSVNGNVRAKEVVVETGWSDFVFDKNYVLKSLSEVEKFIQDNKHLPGIPTADEVAKNGVSLGQSDSLLLQKVEELTLYIIAQGKQIQELQKENAEIKAKLAGN